MWVDAIAGAYTALWLTMWCTGALYAWRWWKNRKAMDIATGALFAGIGIAFVGHGTDQTIWTASNIDRALGEGYYLGLSIWIAKEQPWIVVLVKYLASLGAFFHLHVAVLHTWSHSLKATVFVLSSLWAGVVLIAMLVFR